MKKYSVPKYRFKIWHLLIPFILIVVVAFGAGFFKFIKTILGAVNTAGSKVTKAFGLDSETNKRANEIETIDVVWSGEMYVLWCKDNARTPEEWHNETIGKEYVNKVHEAQSFMGGVKMEKYVPFFQGFRSKIDFSSFCWFWAKEEGSSLASWMLSGWAFGAVASMGNEDICKLDDIIDGKDDLSL